MTGIVICPECGELGNFSYFGETDPTGISWMVVHHTREYEEHTDILGCVRKREIVIRHFHQQSDLERQPWYESWKRFYDDYNECAEKEMIQ